MVVSLEKVLYICKMIGIYKITNIKNNKVYIGSSKDVEKRIYNHKLRLKYGIHINKHLQSSYNKYGKENFKFEILVQIKEFILRKAEQFYINKYQSINPKYGYNKAVVISNCWDNLEKIEKPKSTLYFGAYNKEGKLIKVFRNKQEILKYSKNINMTTVYQSCKSKLTKKALNYFWIRLDVSKEKFKNKIKVGFRKGRHRKIIQLTMNNEYLNEWISAVEAAKHLNLSSFNITRCLKTNNIYKNFKWYYSPNN